MPMELKAKPIALIVFNTAKRYLFHYAINPIKCFNIISYFCYWVNFTTGLIDLKLVLKKP